MWAYESIAGGTNHHRDSVILRDSVRSKLRKGTEPPVSFNRATVVEMVQGRSKPHSRFQRKIESPFKKISS